MSDVGDLTVHQALLRQAEAAAHMQTLMAASASQLGGLGVGHLGAQFAANLTSAFPQLSQMSAQLGLHTQLQAQLQAQIQALSQQQQQGALLVSSSLIGRWPCWPLFLKKKESTPFWLVMAVGLDSQTDVSATLSHEVCYRLLHFHWRSTRSVSALVCLSAFRVYCSSFVARDWI